MRILVAGLGSMGKRRIGNLQELGAGPIAGFDVRSDRRTEAQERFGVAVYDDLERALAAHTPAAVVVSTPPDRHRDIALAAVRAGCHVFTELNLDRAAVGALIHAKAASPNVVVAPSSTMRHHAAVRRVKELVAGGALGPPLLFTYHSGQWLPDWHPLEDYRAFFASSRATGACREILLLELSWLVWVFGPVESVEAVRAKVSTLEADIDDVYQVVLRFASGLVGHVLVDAIARPAVRLLRACGEGGTVEWDAYAPSLRRYDPAAKTWHAHGGSAGSGFDRESMYVSEMRAFLDACAGETGPAYTLEDERGVLRILDAIDRAAVDGCRVAVAK